ncbi:MAG: hypothetical protein JXQ76_00305, partial [Campylobacterales bacterium]|nr:hypothetical protein [Campylobacterales bacterium]
MIPLTQLLNYLFIAYAFVIPLSRAGIVVFLLLILLVWIFFTKNHLKDIENIYQSNAFKAFVLFWLYNFLSLLWVEQQNLSDALKIVVKYWYFLTVIVIANYIQKEKILTVLSAFILGMFISELLSYGIFFELISLNRGSPNDPTPFMNHLDYGLFLAFTSLLLLSRLLYEQSLKYRLFYLLFFISVTINLFIVGGRIGYVAFVISLIILFMHRFEHRLRAFVVALGVLVTIVSLAYNFSSTFKDRLIASIESI